MALKQSRKEIKHAENDKVFIDTELFIILMSCLLIICISGFIYTNISINKIQSKVDDVYIKTGFIENAIGYSKEYMYKIDTRSRRLVDKLNEDNYDYLECTKVDSTKLNCIKKKNPEVVWKDTPTGTEMYVSNKRTEPQEVSAPISVEWSYTLLK
jgi:hypothetical protein